ncbi:Alpha/Beta hydrolase protein [Crucibulum laeve]|uniref:Alpha/Beta hydrolase protein n=1 Tax=Crucibulum laeve TaxID=68775 RepID=A0A5C3M4W0_9AGAR|nr:Alpha/Beta hydrolase protein [Crucibulum laeve]
MRHFVFTAPTTLNLKAIAGFKMTAKQYSMSQSNVQGFTLLFAHGLGAHKEQWEPTIQYLFKGAINSNLIREAWSFDWPSHGDAAILNQDILNAQEGRTVSICDWGSIIDAFINSTIMIGHRIILIGHSGGGGAVTMATESFHKSSPVRALIVIEPNMATEEIWNPHWEDRMIALNLCVGGTLTRRDSWPSKDQAYNYFNHRMPWKRWDIRMLRILTEFGLEELPSRSCRLKCSKVQEAAGFVEIQSYFAATRQFSRICRVLPSHIIWGENYDNPFIPKFMKEFTSKLYEQYVSTTIIQSTGHMVLQEQPDKLAQRIEDIITKINPGTYQQLSKL